MLLANTIETTGVIKNQQESILDELLPSSKTGKVRIIIIMDESNIDKSQPNVIEDEKLNILPDIFYTLLIKQNTSNLIEKIYIMDKVFIDSNIWIYAFWDSLIVASSIENKSSILYSEGMQHNQLIDDKLKIINPFFSNENF